MHVHCSYADIAFHPIDEIINNNPDFTIPLWLRYRDDVYCVWVMGLEKLKEFLAWINSIHPNLKFTMSYSTDGTAYLDILTYIKGPKICTTLYTKPSDTHAYLQPTSCHPKHVCKNIPHGEAQRIRKICSEEDEYQENKDLMIKYFASRGYNDTYTRDQFDQLDSVDRDSLIPDLEISFDMPNERPQLRRLPLVLDFHPSFAGASKSINKYKYILDLDPSLKGCIDKQKLFVTFRRCKTIGDILVHSRYPYQKFTDHKGNVNCGKCILCKYYLSKNCKVIKSCSTNQILNINQTITCQDGHVVYVISDLLCNRQNVGSTDDNMRCRFSNHKSHIKQNRPTCRVALHYNDRKIHKLDYNNDINSHLPAELQVTLIDKVVPDPWDTKESITTKLKNKEAYWQSQLKSLESDGGLNVRNERLFAKKLTSLTHGSS